MSAPAEEVVQGPELGETVELFDFDFTPLDASGPVLHLTPNVAGSDMIERGGVRYYPAPIASSGYDRGGDTDDRGGGSQIPQPRIKVGAAIPLISPWVWATQGMVGVEVTRTRVLRRWLDGESDPDATGFLKFDIHEVEQRVRHTPTEIEFRLVARIDRAGKQLPGRRVLRNSCRHRYREWTGAAFDYSKATCPYTGASTFTAADNPATNATDRCSKRFSGCGARFPTGALPITAFLGISRPR